MRTLLRCLLVLSLWIGVSGAASVPATLATPPSTPQSDQSDLHARLLDLLGGVGICGDEDSEEDDVLCGGDLLAGLVTNPAMLLMSRGTCSRLLEQLYSRQVCDPARDDCGQLQRGNLPPPQSVQVSPAPSSGLLARHNAELQPLLARARTLRARDDPDPASYNSRPVPPPPRAALA
ncbi:MAG: hypothetical protein H0T76_01790 [Nannocystis sp.]|nr:hypothetical protein [Nannocystis sp.]MBA3545195.1 hypothetical protein [Nannocystis sp.]